MQWKQFSCPTQTGHLIKNLTTIWSNVWPWKLHGTAEVSSKRVTLRWLTHNQRNRKFTDGNVMKHVWIPISNAKLQHANTNILYQVITEIKDHIYIITVTQNSEGIKTVSFIEPHNIKAGECSTTLQQFNICFETSLTITIIGYLDYVHHQVF